MTAPTLQTLVSALLVTGIALFSAACLHLFVTEIAGDLRRAFAKDQAGKPGASNRKSSAAGIVTPKPAP